jgi:hypothetical protein
MKAESESQMNEICNLIKAYGTPTGSRVIGGFTEKSDYDYFMTVADAKRIYDSLGIEFNLKCLGEYAQLFASYKYTLFGAEVNLILVDDLTDLGAWNHATEVMILLDDYYDIERKQIFGQLLLEYYETFCQDDEKLEMARFLWLPGYKEEIKRRSF